jgi:GNAT superfamily N-acetyltransferase
VIRVEAFRGAAARRWLPDVARLRIEVFREWPYLYEGSLAYEETYLAAYTRSERSVIALAFDGDQVVGASTALPAADHDEEIGPPLLAAGYDPSRIYYFGESVLRRDRRGRGLGHAFFDVREATARELGFELAAFCAVARPADHPARPADDRPLDAFWTGRGFVRRPDIVASFRWHDVGAPEGETDKPMVFWLKSLAGAP